ncbi:site-specific integrase [Pelotomaculum terephthalicicum JT]|uniref:tyrosine-type recombinase/integrase n=1 Tax=Pelotomaculum TaxID=191373 RepID=UPI0009C8DEA1|nr:MULTISPECIES: tyrosine-type recombinase/integrase [Pelotomaculum]MCG9967437.1 site-specific integrase [Pelotomaculum terephthalicicum JT]OPX87728.1 MAG: putative prophage phiRv2 integrase [Pelotomaculum sp. PtaB.Bin117]OPY61629.1 MAG: putative prophage phiRv2 integrase [Pelotomaculum sp. PtaU1.Bin065]
MIEGHPQIKNGYWYAVLNIRDETGKQKPKWFATHLPAKGNKKRAEEILTELRIKHTGLEDIRRNSRGIYFDEYMANWVSNMQGKVSPTTYSSYKNIVQNSVCPYFRERATLLSNLKPDHIKGYYEYLHDRGVSNNTIIRHHANIRKALQEAYQKDLIPRNPADQVQWPKAEDFIYNPYSVEEANRLLEVVKGEKLELVVTLALFYGLRRSEVLGLRWGAVDFERETIIINHSLNQAFIDGKYTVLPQDKLKRTASLRTMPLIQTIKELLLRVKEARNHKESDYICIDEKGEVIKPSYVSKEFASLLKRHNLRPIRFHDLRHSCATDFDINFGIN